MSEKGDRVSLFVTVVEPHGKVCRFWAQTNTEAGQRVETLMQEAEHEASSQPPVAFDAVAVGDVFLAKFKEDNKWYRAKVKAVNKTTEQITVFFIDYGNEEIVNAGEIQKGQGKYFEVPPQATQFFLGDIQAKNGYEWAEIELSGLREQLVYGEFVGFVLNVGSVGIPPTLRVFTDEGQRETVVTTVIAAGYGTRATVCMEPPFSQTSLEPNRNYHVYVVFYESPLNFWIQLVDNEEQLINFQDLVATEIDDSSPKAQHVSLGSVCIAKFIDTESDLETYYRAVVTAINTNGTCDVLFVDYGNSETLSLDQLKAIPAQYKDLPCQAIQCCLHGSLSNADEFQKMLESEHIYANVASVMETGLHVVQLTENPNVPAIKKVPQPQSVTRLTAAPVQENKLSNNNEVVHRSYKPLQFNVGKHVDLCISHVEPTGHFYCQLLENAPRLKQLMKGLQESNGTMLNISGVGTPCVTKSVVDKGLMYRSKILSQSRDRVTVQHVDFGLTEEVPSSSVLFIDESLMDMPSHAIYCALAKSEGINPKAVTNLLRQYESQTALVGTVMLKSGQQYEMELVDTSGITDVYLVERLRTNTVKSSPAQVEFNKLSIQEGQWIDTQVTFIADPAHIYCQFVSTQDELIALMQRIGAHCASSQAQRLTSREPGTPCLARYTEDGEWYRAIISGTHPSGGTQVFFVDYGNHDVVSDDSLIAIQPEFIKALPNQCFRGVLDGVVCAPSSWTEEHTSVLFQMAAEERHPTLIVKHELHDDLYVIQMYNAANQCLNREFGAATQKLSPKFTAQGLPGTKKGIKDGSSVTASTGQGWAQWQSPTDICEVKPLEVAPGFKDILIETIVSPDELYCLLADSNDDLTAFMDKINAEYQGLGPQDLLLQSPKPGMFCIARFESDWYRAKILSVTRQSAHVQYIDFGNTETVPFEHIKQMKPDHAKTPAQAVKCGLASIAPAGGRWTEEVNDALDGMINETTMVGVFTQCGPDGRYLIEVIKTVQNGQLMVHEELVKLGLAVNLAAGDANQISVGLNRPQRVSGSAVAGRSVSTSPTPVYSKPSATVGQTVDVNIVHVETPTEFWVQLTQNCTELEELMETIQNSYNEMGPGELRLPSAKVGMAVMAKFSEDDAFYRGEVVRSLTEGGFVIRYVDYGNYEKRTMSDIWEMKVQFMSLPAQAIQCSLADIVPPPTGWSSKTKDILEELVLDKNLLAEVVSVSSDQALTVRLTETQGGTQIIIANRLIAMKLASAIKQPLKQPHVNMDNGPSMSSRASLSNRYSDTSTSSQRQLEQKEMQPQDVAEGDQMRVNIVWANSPASFWCQKIGSLKAIEALMEALNSHYECLRLKDAEIKSPQPGQLCVALYEEDGNWYRSRVLRTRNREAEVLYLDFGNKDRLPWSKLKVIKPEFLDTPQMAIHCGLKGMDVYNGQFSHGVEDYFTQLMSQDLKLRVLQLSPAQGETHTVSISDMSGSDVTDRIEQLQVGKAVKTEVAPRQHAPPARSQTPPSTPPRSQQPSAIDYHTLNTPLRPGKPISMAVTNIESAHSFYCQISTNQAELDNFMDKLHAHYTSRNVQAVTPAQLKQGMPCSAKFSEDEYWYRAQVTKIIGTQEVEVLFVDYGNTEKTTLQNIRPLDQQFASYPVQAFPCILAGVTPNDSLEATMLFRKLVEDKTLQGRVKNQGPPVEVELVDPSNNTDINRQMISKLNTAVRSQVTRYSSPKIPSGTAEVYITHVDSPVSFWVQLVTKEEEILNFAENMLAKYEALGPDEEKLNSVRVNATCAAKFSEDQAWYRGVIENIQGSNVTVRFIDYGNTDVSNAAELKNLSAELLTIPPHAIHCRMSGVVAPPGGWTAKQVDVLSCMENTLIANFCQSGTPTMVELTSDGQDVAAQLGLPKAAERKTDKFPEKKTPTSDIAVYASHVEEAVVYIQLAEDSGMIETISNKLQDTYNAIPSGTMGLEVIEVGGACVAKFSEDESWYRASIENIDGDQVKLRFIDFGNAETTTKSSLKTLTPDLLQHAPFTFRCKPQGLTRPASGWPTGLSEALEEKLLDMEITASFIGTQEPYVVCLKVDGEEVGKMMLDSFPALSDVQQMSVQETTPVEDHFPVYPKQVAPSQSCTASVSHLESPSCIYLQLASDFDELEHITNTLQDTYSVMMPDQSKVTSVGVGRACCAQFSEDEAWYRAVIEEVASQQEATVRFIDFGNSEVTRIATLKDLTPDLLKRPGFAFKCSLDSGSAPTGGWHQDIVAKLEELVIEQEVDTMFTTEETPFTVKMTVSGEDVSTALSAALPESLEGRKDENSEDNVAGVTSVSSHEVAELLQADLNVGEQIFVSSVDSPSLFYVQKETEAEALEEFMEQLSTLCESKSPLVNPTKGQLCCAKFSEDSSWYRAVITDVADEVTVRFCDYGNIDTVPNMDVIPMPSSVSQLKAFAVVCELKDAPTQTWTEDQIEKFTELTNENELEVAEVVKCNRVFSVRLSGGELNINSTMGCTPSVEDTADSEDDFQEATENISVGTPEHKAANTEETQDTEEFLEASENIEVEVETVHVKIEQEEIGDEENREESATSQLTEEIVVTEEESSNDNVAQMRTQDQRSEASDEEDAEEEASNNEVSEEENSEEFTDAAYDMKQDPAKLKSGDVVQVSLTHINSPSQFWCQRTDDLSSNEAAETTAYAVTETCEEGAPPQSVQAGEIYGAKYKSDEWCRVKVEAEEDEQVRAFYIDYGNTDMVYKSDLRTLPDSLKHHSCAFLCLLHGVNTEDNSWSDAAKSYFEELTVDKNLLAKIITCTEEYHIVSLLDMGIPIADKMIEVGHAVKSEVPAYNKDKSDTEESYTSETLSPEKSDNYTYRDLDQAKSTLLFMGDDYDEEDEETFSLCDTTLEDGERAEVIVSHVDNFDSIYIQLKRQEAKLDELIEEMQEAYISTTEQPLEFQSTIREGLICAAQSSQDDIWYRAQLLHMPQSEDVVTVQFVDYGNVESVQEEDLQPLKPKFQTYQKMCLKCSLRGAELLERDMVDAFITETTGKTLLGEVKDVVDGVVCMTLLDMGTDIVSRLAKGENTKIEEILDSDTKAGNAKIPEIVIDEPTKDNNSEDERLSEIDVVPACDKTADTQDTEEIVEELRQSRSLVDDNSDDIHKEDDDTDDTEEDEVEEDDPADATKELMSKHSEDLLENSKNKLVIEETLCEQEDENETSGTYEESSTEDIAVTECEVESRDTDINEDQTSTGEENKADTLNTSRDSESDKPVRDILEHIDAAEAMARDEDIFESDEEVVEKECDKTEVDDRQIDGETVSDKFDEAKEDSLQVDIVETVGEDITAEQAIDEDISDAAQYDTTCKESVKIVESDKESKALVDAELEHKDTQVEDVEEQNTELPDAGTTEDDIERVDDVAEVEAASTDTCAYEDESDTIGAVQVTEEETRTILEQASTAEDPIEEETLPSTNMGAEENASEEPGVTQLMEDSSDTGVEVEEVCKEPEVSQSDNDAICTETELNYQYAHFSVGDKLQVTTSVTTSPRDFWCQLITPSTTDLPLLSDKIQDYCSTDCDSIMVKKCHINMPCFARCSLDGNWYRGIITETSEDGAEVSYVDYGNAEHTELSKLRKMAPEFLALNAQAFKCSLVGVVANEGGVWEETSCARFEELVSDLDLMLTVVGKSPGQFADTEDFAVTLEEDSSSIAYVLIDGGYAKAAQDEDIPRKQSRENQLVFEQETVIAVALYGNPTPSNFQLHAKDDMDAADDDIRNGQAVLVHSKKALVKEVLEDQCLVTFVDDGSEETVARCDVEKLSTEGVSLQPKAFTCKLAGVEAETWTEEAITFFKGFMKCDKLNARIVEVEDNIHQVYLYDLDDPSGTSVNYQLVSHSFAWVLPDSELFSLDDSDTEELINQQDKLESSFLEFNEGRRQSLGELGSDGDPGAAGDGQESLDEVLIFQSPAISAGDVIELRCLSAKDPDSLVCRLLKSQTEFEQFMQELNTQCSKDVGESLKVNKLHSGDTCIAYSDNKETWCRAKILAKEGDSMAVHFVDFGDGATVSLNNLRPVNVTATVLPVQAVTCSVGKVEPLEAEWTTETVTAVSGWCFDKTLTVTVLSVKEDGCLVGAIDMGNDEDLGETLVKGKFAKWLGGSEETEKKEEDEDSDDEADVATETESDVGEDGGTLLKDETSTDDKELD